MILLIDGGTKHIGKERKILKTSFLEVTKRGEMFIDFFGGQKM
jgi:hypothetical protein